VLGLVDSLARRAARRGLRRALAEGSAAWLAVAVAAWIVRLLSRQDRPKVVRAEIRLGERLLVSHVPPPPTRRERRRARRDLDTGADATP